MDDLVARMDRQMVQLFAMVGEGVAGATHALLAGDRQAAKLLADQDAVVDRLYRDIDLQTMRLLTSPDLDHRYVPFLVAIVRMLPDLERNGDLVEHVASRAARGLGAELSPRSRGLVERMGEVATGMWRVTADAYGERLVDAAEVIDGLDDEMDDLHVSLIAEIVSGTMPLPVAIELAMVSRFYERFGDHAVKLARRIGSLASNLPDS
ncbi:MAG: hypothetical protein M0Z93_08260 [Actinomycetota bacterium]|nr:hypothetical protein [Actinomycetota bacterium]